MSPSSWIPRLVLACLVAGLSYGQGGVAPSTVERWQAMSEDERDVLRDRFERFRSLDATAQEALRERHSSLRSAIDRHVAALPEPERAELAGLPYSDRKRVARDLFHASCRFESGLGGREGMSAMLDSLRNVEPELRPHFLKRTCLSLDRGLSVERLGQLGIDLGLSPEAFEQLSREQRRELFRKQFSEHAGGSAREPRGPWGSERAPGHRGAEREGFQRPESPGRRGSGERGSEGPGRGGFGRGGWERPPAAVELPDLTPSLAESLLEAARPKISDFAELRLLPREERHRAIDQRVRTRLEAAAVNMPAALREKLADLDVPTLMSSLRDGIGK